MKQKSSRRNLRMGTGVSRKFLVFALNAFLIVGVHLNASASMDASMPENQLSTTNQQKKLTGKITDETGMPIPGVSVVVKGSTQGTITNIDGIYEINVEEGDVLLFSFVGFVSQEVPVAGLTALDVTMKEDVKGLDEVVVVGYGTQKKTEITSSVAKVSAENFNQGFAANPLQVVEGKVAGLQIVRSSGTDPNAEPAILLRGQSTLGANTSPLVIIDGVSGGDLNTVAPEDIASVDVLKDGSAAAIYGTRGSNGVIIITTKKGTQGALNVEYSGYVSAERINKRPDIMNADEYRQLANKLDKEIVDGGVSIDWYDALVQKPVSHVHNLSFSGGTEKLSYRASLNYRNLEGVVINTGQEYINGRINVTHQGFDDRLKVNLNIAHSIIERNYADQGSDFIYSDDIPEYDVFTGAVTANPTLPIYDENGKFTVFSGFGEANPVAKLEQELRDGSLRKTVSSLRINYDLFSGLNVGAFGAYEVKSNYDRAYQGIDSPSSILNGRQGFARQYYNDTQKRLLEFTLDYKKIINEVHSIGVLGGYSYEDNENAWFYAENSNFLTDITSYNHLNAGTFLVEGKAGMDSYKYKDRLVAFFGRFTYSYMGKYLLSATYRREGSSRFGENNKWGNFPAVSLGWRISEEGFMQSQEFVNNLKLRLGYGETGNIVYLPYLSLDVVKATGELVEYNGMMIPQYSQFRNANPDLGWETKKELNIGLDFGFLQNRISGSLDAYQRKTESMLWQLNVPVPPYNYPLMWANIGEIKNEGIELALNSQIINNTDLKVGLDLTFSYNQNEIVSLENKYSDANYIDYEDLPSPGNMGPIFRYEAGRPIGAFYGYKFVEIDENGKWVVEDVNNNGERDDEDRQFLGNGNPKYNFSFAPKVQYKGFDFSMNFRGALGFDLLHSNRLYMESPKAFPINLFRSAMDTPLNDDPLYSDYFLEKGDYLKLDNITLGYTLPQGVLGGLKYARIYASALNVATFTDYTGLDPEVSLGSRGGYDRRGYYPRTTTYTFGLNVKF